MKLAPVFIGTATETFTAYKSGAVATVMHSIACCAAKDGMHINVIAKKLPGVEPYADVSSELFDYPAPPRSLVTLFWYRLERKVRSWTRLRQGAWMSNLEHLLCKPKYSNRPWVISNEPELLVFLKRRFPEQKLYAWFHNQLPCKSYARKRLVKSCEGVLAVSDFTREWLIDYYAAQPHQVHTVYNGVDCNVFRPKAADLLAKPTIQFVGRTGIEKAPDLLLKACLRLARQTKDFRVRIVGSNHWDGYTYDEYQSQINSLCTQLRSVGIEAEQTGHVDRIELPKLMATAQIHVTPSRWPEPFGLTTLEGMACGLATVAAKNGGTTEIIGNAGILFRSDDENDLYLKLRKLVTNPSLTREYSTACRNRAQQFSWERSWETLKSIVCCSAGSVESCHVSEMPNAQ